MAKTLTPPSWASAGNVIGYTFSTELKQPVLQNILAPVSRVTKGMVSQFEREFASLSSVNRFPSVYYRNGHATMDHEDADNIGWVGEQHWRCLFFGNADNAWIHARPHLDKTLPPDKAKAELFDKRVKYAENLKGLGLFPSYHNVKSGRFLLPLGVKKGVGRLIEVWQTSAEEILIHPSRNPFYWVADPDTQALLHTLATTKEIMRLDRVHAHKVPQPAAPQAAITSSMQNKPHPVP